MKVNQTIKTNTTITSNTLAIILLVCPVFHNPTEKKKLSASLGPSIEGNITYDAISNTLRELKIGNHEDVLKECKETIEENKGTLKNRYLHSEEEAVLITTYTWDKKNVEDENKPYRRLNSMLWDYKAQEQESNPGSYLRMLLRALRKLPRTRPQTLYRGIKRRKQKYTVGEVLLWKGFSSTSTSMRATKTFLKDNITRKADGTLFEIRGMWGYSISDFSVFSKEQGKNKQTKQTTFFHFITHIKHHIFTFAHSLTHSFFSRGPFGAHAEVHCEECDRTGRPHSCCC